MVDSELIRKYNVPGPRYTSYPTVPFWQENEPAAEAWLASVEQNIRHFKSRKASVYIHLPYCESMCTFCGCFKRITKNHQLEMPYVEALLSEWEIYRRRFGLEIAELHLGGGTPTFFHPNSLEHLVRGLNPGGAGEEAEFSFEAHPGNTSREHLETLFRLGFRRVSFGVQDYDPKVQQAIHRFQTPGEVREMTRVAREVGYRSVSHDLVYGLPKQDAEGLVQTVRETIAMRPDRVSLYSYAHVPWIKGNGQRGFDENDLPDGDTKRWLYETARALFLGAGYLEIGMDHFALPEDDLSRAFDQKILHRKLHGYTTTKTNLLIGLGASSISDSWFAFAQNEKSIENYREKAKNGELSLSKGHFLSDEDLLIRRYILELMCSFETTLPGGRLGSEIRERLQDLLHDGLVRLDKNKINVVPQGIPFVRNICMAFDEYLNRESSPQYGNMFSKTI